MRRRKTGEGYGKDVREGEREDGGDKERKRVKRRKIRRRIWEGHKRRKNKGRKR